jgi:hypothetical protein
MTSYYENLDRLIQLGDSRAMDEVLTLIEGGDEEVLYKLLAVKEAREQRERPITMTTIVVREEKI